MKAIMRQLLEGTRFLHERGILHRDLKPSNLIVSLPPTGSPAPDESAKADTASSGSGVGTPESSSSCCSGQRNVGTRNGHDSFVDDGAETTGKTPVTSATSEDIGRGWSIGRSKRRRWGGGAGFGHGRARCGGDEHASPVLLKVADFSSAVDEGAMAAGLYGATGPTQDEETPLYAPPEVLFDTKVSAPRQRPGIASCPLLLVSMWLV